MSRTVRGVAVVALTEVVMRRRSLTAVLERTLGDLSSARDRALAQEICYGVLRWLPRLEVMLGGLLDRPLKPKDGDLRCLLLAGLYQLIYMRIPAHAAVAETVGVAAELGKPWAKGLVNAVLRRAQREVKRITTLADATEVGVTAHPAWLLEALRSAWPTEWQDIVAANNARAPLALRVNRSRLSREAYLEKLHEAGMPARPFRHAPDGLVLEQARDVSGLPGFAEGEVSVQDGAAQLAATLLDLRSGQRVLDACAAPGGKTAHILEVLAALGDTAAQVLAVDIDAARLKQVSDNLGRLGMAAEVREADAARPEPWWNGTPFDRILLDAPCSATGVIRRHPDIKLLRRPADIAELANRQLEMLQAVWPLLRPGGMLLYATCSVLPQENVQVLQRFLETHADAREAPLTVAWGHAREVGRQILPGDDDMDGFFYARLERICD